MKRFKVGDLAKIIKAKNYPEALGSLCEIIEIDTINNLGKLRDYRIKVIGFNCPITADGSFTSHDKYLAPITDPDSSIPSQVYQIDGF